MTTTELAEEASMMPKPAETRSTIEEGRNDMTTATKQTGGGSWAVEKQLAESWPILLLVFGVAVYACVCMIGLVVGMTVVHMG